MVYNGLCYQAHYRFFGRKESVWLVIKVIERENTVIPTFTIAYSLLE